MMHSLLVIARRGLLMGTLACGAFAPAIAGDDPFPGERWKTQLAAGALSTEQIADGAARALRAQADELTTFDSNWGDFMELARKKGVLSDDLWRQYLLGALRPRHWVAAGATRRAGLPMWMEQEMTRAGSRGFPASVTATREDDLSGIARESKSRPFDLAKTGGRGMGFMEKLAQPRYAKLEPGPQTYHYRYVIQVFDTKRGEPPAGPPFGERIIEETIPWRLLQENEPMPPPERKADPALAPMLPPGFRVQLVRDERDPTFVEVMIQADHPPADMAFALSLRAGGETWPLGPVAWGKGRIGWWAFTLDLPEGIETAEAVLQPSPEAASTLASRESALYRVMEIRSIWDGPEVVIPGVGIHQQKLQMVKLAAPSPKEALDYALEQMNPAEAVTKQLRQTRDKDAARATLEPRREPAARFALGCLLTAEGRYADAMERFLEARTRAPEPAMLRQVQHEQRRLCALWLQQAEAGDAAAMLALGLAYEQGHGVAADVQEAKRWFRLGSNAGNAAAMFRLAALYEQMAGASVDTEQSRQWYRDQTLEWYRKSAHLGHEPAQQWTTRHDH